MTVISLSLLLCMLSCRAWGAQLAAADGAMNWAVSSSSSLALAKSSPPSTKILAFVSQPTKKQSHHALHASNLRCATMFNARCDSSGIVFKYTFPPTRSRYYVADTSCAQNNCHGSCHQHITTQLYSTINDDNNILQQTTSANVIERLELNQQFERWKFLQQLLDGEIQPLDIENVLILVLSSYLQHGPTALTSDNKDENGGNASPVLNNEQKSNMRGVMRVSDGIGDSRFLHMLVLPPVDYESMTIDIMEDESYNNGEDSNNIIEVDTNALSILQQIERLLPDPEEDEEANNSSWDVVIDLYGRESVKIKETALQQEKESSRYIVSSSSGNLECCVNNLQWRALCTVGRVLIHYDFLTKGVLNEDTFRD